MHYSWAWPRAMQKGLNNLSAEMSKSLKACCQAHLVSAHTLPPPPPLPVVLVQHEGPFQGPLHPFSCLQHDAKLRSSPCGQPTERWRVPQLDCDLVPHCFPSFACVNTLNNL